MRDCAIISTRITELSPTSAPSLTNGDNQGMPMASMPTAIGSGTCSRLKGTTPVNTQDTSTYSPAQIASEPSSPTGILRRGFFVSCATQDTASKPISAKNTTAAPRSTPLKPNSPSCPLFGGIKAPFGLEGVTQLAVSTYPMPAAIKISTIATLFTTIQLFTRVDSCTPRVSSSVAAATISIAGTFSQAPVRLHPATASQTNGDSDHRSGNTMPKFLKILPA